MKEIEVGVLLKQIDFPEDLRKFKKSDLPEICAELRTFIIDTVSLHGGHLAASLGVVELTVALHYVFNTPEDKLVWDVGHQAYGHKILTGRRKNFGLNRKWNGLSGFPKRSESVYDAFGTGHSSTSISAALGMAIADRLLGNLTPQHIAVIGDGALTAGVSFEALNHAGVSHTNILVVVNDNNMSIDPSVGGLEHSFLGNGKVLKIGDNDRLDVLRNPESTTANWFESLGFQYFGPIDGHDVTTLVKTLSLLKEVDGPKMLHIKTVKGKGFKPAEENQTKWHATSAFDKITGARDTPKTDDPRLTKFQDVFGKTLLELAKQNPKVVGITPAMPTGSSLNIMMAAEPTRTIDVGIAEQHAVTLSAGMATKGMKVFCTVYSTFLQRAYDMVIHDVAIQDLPVIFCIDRAGLVGNDGATHQGLYDMAYLRCIPNFIVSAPMDEIELRNLMFTAQLETTHHPFAIRYPRGKGKLVDWQQSFSKVPIGKGRILQEGKKVVVLSVGRPGVDVREAIQNLEKQGIEIGHYDMRFVKPLDQALLKRAAEQYEAVLTVEDGCLMGGFCSAVLEFYNEQQIAVRVKRLGVSDQVIEQGSQEEQRAFCGLDAKSIEESIRLLYLEVEE